MPRCQACLRHTGFVGIGTPVSRQFLNILRRYTLDVPCPTADDVRTVLQEAGVAQAFGSVYPDTGSSKQTAVGFMQDVGQMLPVADATRKLERGGPLP